MTGRPPIVWEQAIKAERTCVVLGGMIGTRAHSDVVVVVVVVVDGVVAAVLVFLPLLWLLLLLLQPSSVPASFQLVSASL